MSDETKSNLPALSRQVSELVLAGSLQHAEEACRKAADEHGDYAVAEVLSTLPPQVTALHLAGFDGGKTSLATLLVPPKAWAESLAYLAATWPDDMIEDDPERIAENLFNHIHGVVYATDDEERRHELLSEASATDWGATAFAILWSLAPKEILEVAGEINSQGPATPTARPRPTATSCRWRSTWPGPARTAGSVRCWSCSRNTATAPTWPTSSCRTTRTRTRTSRSAQHPRTAVPPAQAGAVGAHAEAQHAPQHRHGHLLVSGASASMLPAIVIEKLPRLIRAIRHLADSATPADAAGLADELAGITAMVAEKFTNDRTAEGIQRALLLSVGGMSLGLEYLLEDETDDEVGDKAAPAS
jgi:hypothetical protein